MQWAIILIVALLILGAWYLSTTAGRLDRLNKRVESSEHSLETQLLRRASLATELAASGVLDPASSAVLADAAHAVRVAPQDRSEERALAESNLTDVLDALFGDPNTVAAMRQTPGGAELAAELDTATRRLAMSHRFLNDGVRANRDVRNQRLVRWFRLAGTSVAPESFEFDDTPPSGFGQR